MNVTRLFSGLYVACEWVMRLAIVNLLWFGLTLLGGVIFGITPASVAMFTICRKWVEGEREIPLARTFWSIYRKEFVKSNYLGVILIAIGVLLFVDIQFFSSMEGAVFQLLHILMLLLLLNFVVIMIYIFPVYVYYDIKTLQYIKYAIIIGLTNPLQTLIIAFYFVILYVLSINIVAVFIFLSVAPMSMLIMLVSYRIFNKIQQQVANQET
ncbi:YesL family protein [Evansella sp. AB-P1]|uniref:YesL family protein n=1 Tax=Evansella sp. AB-P1 TaxID=3037653 RepID=UPI00241D7A6F|nr:YesL family protein [Evansella sp. AB-P1]MDG5786916.1 YesL family protein [Evansella sp. AB-P1]